MRAVVQQSVYDEERAKWYLEDEAKVRDMPTAREAELLTRDLKPQQGTFGMSK